MQVDPLKPKLKPPGTKLLKLEYDGRLSNFGFRFSLRRYNTTGDKVRAAGKVGRCSLTALKPELKARLDSQFQRLKLKCDKPL